MALCQAYADNRQLIYTGYSPDLFGTRRLDLFREAHEGARGMLVVTDLRMRAWGYMTPAYMILSLNEKRDKENFSGLSIRKDLNTIKDYERFARAKLLHDRAEGETFPFGRPDMLQLLRRTSNFLATQPVDRLYALLGLTGTDHIKPVYSEQQTLNVVATKFAAHFITKGSMSEVLSTAGIRSATPSPNDPPSWVPNWTKMTYSQDMQIGFNRLADIQDEKNADRDKARRSRPREARRRARKHGPRTLTGYTRRRATCRSPSTSTKSRHRSRSRSPRLIASSSSCRASCASAYRCTWG